MKFRDKLAAAKATTAKVWALTTPYFSSEEKWKARALLAAIIVLNLGAVYMLVQINEWNRVFYDALQNKDQAVFWQQLLRFTYLAFAYIIIAVYRFYLTQLLELRWRAWMTTHYLQRWLAGQAFYRMELARFSTKLPGRILDCPSFTVPANWAWAAPIKPGSPGPMNTVMTSSSRLTATSRIRPATFIDCSRI